MNPFCHLQARYTGRFILGVLSLLVLMCVIERPSYAEGAASSVSNCEIGSRAARAGFWTWQPGSQVQVYILQKDFASEEIPYLTKPLELWDAVWESTGSRVRITYAGTTTVPRECENCLTIGRSRIYNVKTRHGSEIKAYGVIGTRIIKYATIAIDPKLTNSKSLTNAVAHELGHSFGLLDCYDCKGGSTVMTKFTGMSISNNVEGPTGCDIAQVRKAYKELELRERAAPVAEVQEDEGEEPVLDDTPLVVPKP